MMLDKKQVIALVSIAMMSFLVGTTFNINFVAMGNGDGNPWGNVWTAISELQSQVQSMNQTIQSLNETIEALRTEIPKKTQIITEFGYADWTQLPLTDVWADLLTIPDVIVPEGASLFTVTSVDLRGTEVTCSPVAFRYRENDTYTENRAQGFGSIYELGTEMEIVETHHSWTNLTAGTYTFAIQYKVVPTRTVYVCNARLTLIIF